MQSIVIQSFTQLFNFLKKLHLVDSLKDLAKKTGYNYTYLSELNTLRKPMTAEFVRNINEKLKVSFALSPIDYEKMMTIPDFLDQYGLNKNELCEKLGVSENILDDAISGKTSVFDKWNDNIFEEYSVRLKSGEKTLKEIKEVPYGKEIPFFNQEVYGTISPVLDDYVTMQPYAIKKIPMFMAADGAVQVKGHSMKGYINNGDWIVIKKITNRNFIIYGEPYLVITKSDNLKTVKFVKESMDDPDCLTLTPYNIEQFEPQDIQKEEILELYSIVGLFRSM